VGYGKRGAVAPAPCPHSGQAAGASTASLKDILNNEVVQVEGMVCVGVPIGSPQFVQAFVAEKSKNMVEDVKKLHLLTDPGVHFKLVRFCHNTRLAHLNHDLPPSTMANPVCGVQTVDYAVVNEVLAKGTGNQSATWEWSVMNWHRMTAQLPHHQGGLGLIPAWLMADSLESIEDGLVGCFGAARASCRSGCDRPLRGWLFTIGRRLLRSGAKERRCLITGYLLHPQVRAKTPATVDPENK